MAKQPDPRHVLERFTPATRAWFEGAFAAPTPAQIGAWDAISTGRHALVIAPTGSGKTLSAFLWALDSFARTATEITAPALPGLETGDRPAAATRPKTGGTHSAGTRVLYISPLKALGVDVERNLRAPLVGIKATAAHLGLAVPQVSVGVRSGDTPANERRKLVTNPPDILITTPESLYLMLTSRARESLAGVHTVILDEVHAVAGTKRGAHLALSLERLDALLADPGAAHRAFGDRGAARGGGALCGRRCPGVRDRPADHQDLGFERAGAGGGHDGPAGRRGRARPGPGFRAGPAGEHLAARRGTDRRFDRGEPLHDRVRQFPAPGRAADRQVERDPRIPGDRNRRGIQALPRTASAPPARR